jgi:hypothetical protein
VQINLSSGPAELRGFLLLDAALIGTDPVDIDLMTMLCGLRSGKKIDACRTRLVRKLDRLSRNLAFVATLMESGVELVAG